MSSLGLLSVVDVLLYSTAGIVAVGTMVVALLLSRSRFYQRTLRTQAQRETVKSMSREDKKFLTSMQAEETIEAVLREEGWQHIFLRRRAYVARVGHNREIDVIAVGPVVLVVEVKHWQGDIWSNGPKWFQCPNRRRPRNTLEFEDVQEDNVEKAAALRRYLENTRRIVLTDFDKSAMATKGSEGASGTWYSDATLHKHVGRVVLPVVVFTNPRARLDPASVDAKPYVFTLNTFRVFARAALRGHIQWDAPNTIARMPKWRMMFGRWGSPRLQADGTAFLSAEVQEEVSCAVDVMRTWDLIYLHNGTLVTGDVQLVDVPNAHCKYERKHLLDIDIHWNTGVSGLFKTFMTNEAATVRLVLCTYKRLAVKKNENKPRDEDGNIFFSVVPKKTNMNLNDRIVVRSAGSLHTQVIALNDIRSIKLSHHFHEVEASIA